MRYLIITLAIAFLFTVYSHAQLSDYGFKFGLQFNQALPATEFWESDGLKESYVGRGLLRLDLGRSFQMEIGGGYGSLAGYGRLENYYRTEIIPVDWRILLTPIESDVWNPYLYVGLGALHYNVTDTPLVVSPKKPIEKEGWTGYVPGGIGAEFKLSDVVLLDISVGINYSFTDNLNYFKAGSTYDAYYTAGLSLTFVSGYGRTDEDGDGLTKNEEEKLGTNHLNPDTDNDGLKDGEEVNLYKTNPLKVDTDDDGLNDYEEIFTHKTNPNKVDSDDDGLNDNDELRIHKTNPMLLDTDGDGISDGEEAVRYKTNPLAADTDGDGLSDYDELMQYKTDPLRGDSDNDGLSDADEIMKYKTDPMNIDTDGGTVNDFAEVKRGSNPLDAEDDIPKVGVPIILEGITFETDRADITPESEKVLIDAFTTLNSYPEMEVEIHGYTDNVGSRSYNIKLSQKRADAVRIWLVNKGVGAERIIAKGFGPDNPIAPNDTPEGRRQNRRIEFLRVK